AVLRACHEARIGVVPLGGGTGLVGGQVFSGDGPDPLILSLEGMKKVRAIYPEEDVLVTEAGVTLQAVREAANGARRVALLAIGSLVMGQIGCIQATNAGWGIVLRWCNAREVCLVIEAVMAYGCLMRGLTRLRTDNTGFVVRDLLFGTKGS